MADALADDSPSQAKKIGNTNPSALPGNPPPPTNPGWPGSAPGAPTQPSAPADFAGGSSGPGAPGQFPFHSGPGAPGQYPGPPSAPGGFPPGPGIPGQYPPGAPGQFPSSQPGGDNGMYGPGGPGAFPPPAGPSSFPAFPAGGFPPIPAGSWGPPAGGGFPPAPGQFGPGIGPMGPYVFLGGPAAPGGMLMMPHDLPLHAGIMPRLLITIVGEPVPGADRFQVDFIKGPDVVFHFNPRFNEQTIVRNSSVGGCWGPEEREGGFPFVHGCRFEQMKILVEEDMYKVAVDGTHLLEYEHRVGGMEDVTLVRVAGDVVLYSAAPSMI
uniref:Galectin n=1 Tax=Mola mola TaxID=94237 RepID=A0A3Q3W863_MOLML